MSISEHIANSGLTREQISAKAGISRAMLSAIESGRRRISLDKAPRLAEVLGVDVGEVRPDVAALFRQKGAA